MPLCSTTQTWVRNLNVNGTHSQYIVQLKRHISCCGFDKYQIFMNGEEIDHELKDNPCSPLCCPGGRYEWQVDGHYFLLMFNNLSFTSSFGKHRLFIDGIDCNTDREFSAFWRRRGWQFLILGVVLVIFGTILSLVYHFVNHHMISLHALLYIGYGCFCSGVSFIVYGLIPVLRYRQPLIYQNVVYDIRGDDVNQV